MKNLRKMLAIFAASAVMCAAVPAFAEVTATGDFDDDAVTADYSQTLTNNIVSATVDLESATAGREMTFLILDADADTNAEEDEDGKTYLASDILYIDQQTLTAQADTFTGVINASRITGAEGTAIPEGSYPIKLGYYDANGTFTIANATMVIGEAQGGGTTIEILWGDITGDTYIDSEDALAALLKLAGKTPQYTVSGYTATVGDSFAGYLWGDITGDTYIDSEDALAALLKLAGKTPQYTVNGNTITVGQTIEATIDEN